MYYSIPESPGRPSPSPPLQSSTSMPHPYAPHQTGGTPGGQASPSQSMLEYESSRRAELLRRLNERKQQQQQRRQRQGQQDSSAMLRSSNIEGNSSFAGEPALASSNNQFLTGEGLESREYSRSPSVGQQHHGGIPPAGPNGGGGFRDTIQTSFADLVQQRSSASRARSYSGRSVSPPTNQFQDIPGIVVDGPSRGASKAASAVASVAESRAESPVKSAKMESEEAFRELLHDVRSTQSKQASILSRSLASASAPDAAACEELLHLQSTYQQSLLADGVTSPWLPEGARRATRQLGELLQLQHDALKSLAAATKSSVEKKSDPKYLTELASRAADILQAGEGALNSALAAVGGGPIVPSGSSPLPAAGGVNTPRQAVIDASSYTTTPGGTRVPKRVMKQKVEELAKNVTVLESANDTLLDELGGTVKTTDEAMHALSADNARLSSKISTLEGALKDSHKQNLELQDRLVNSSVDDVARLSEANAQIHRLSEALEAAQQAQLQQQYHQQQQQQQQQQASRSGSHPGLPPMADQRSSSGRQRSSSSTQAPYTQISGSREASVAHELAELEDEKRRLRLALEHAEQKRTEVEQRAQEAEEKLMHIEAHHMDAVRPLEAQIHEKDNMLHNIRARIAEVEAEAKRHFARCEKLETAHSDTTRRLHAKEQEVAEVRRALSAYEMSKHRGGAGGERTASKQQQYRGDEPMDDDGAMAAKLREEQLVGRVRQLEGRCEMLDLEVQRYKKVQLSQRVQLHEQQQQLLTREEKALEVDATIGGEPQGPLFGRTQQPRATGSTPPRRSSPAKARAAPPSEVSVRTDRLSPVLKSHSGPSQNVSAMMLDSSLAHDLSSVAASTPRAKPQADAPRPRTTIDTSSGSTSNVAKVLKDAKLLLTEVTGAKRQQHHQQHHQSFSGAARVADSSTEPRELDSGSKRDSSGAMQSQRNTSSGAGSEGAMLHNGGGGGTATRESSYLRADAVEIAPPARPIVDSDPPAVFSTQRAATSAHDTVVGDLRRQEARLLEEVRALEGQENAVLEKRTVVSSTLLAQRNQLLMKNAPDEQVQALNDQISSLMLKINQAQAQIEVNRRAAMSKLDLVQRQLRNA